MSYREAQELLDSIESERKPGSAAVYRIGNGEHIGIWQRFDQKWAIWKLSKMEVN